MVWARRVIAPSRAMRVARVCLATAYAGTGWELTLSVSVLSNRVTRFGSRGVTGGRLLPCCVASEQFGYGLWCKR